MSVDLQAGDRGWTLGAPTLLFAFFSTISARLEPEGWGTRYPAVMGDLYGGDVAPAAIPAVRAELPAIRRELAALPPGDVVWDVEDRSKRPPWGDDIAPEVTSLATYFVTTDGEDLLDVLETGLAYAERRGERAVLR